MRREGGGGSARPFLHPHHPLPPTLKDGRQLVSISIPLLGNGKNWLMWAGHKTINDATGQADVTRDRSSLIMEILPFFCYHDRSLRFIHKPVIQPVNKSGKVVIWAPHLHHPVWLFRDKYFWESRFSFFAAEQVECVDT